MIQAGSWRTLNPVVPQPWLLPIVMSLKPEIPLEYKRGFKKPRGDFLAWKRASFKRDTNPANAGDDAEVPPMRTGRPLNQIRKRSDWAATSGNPCQHVRSLLKKVGFCFAYPSITTYISAKVASESKQGFKIRRLTDWKDLRMFLLEVIRGIYQQPPPDRRAVWTTALKS